jgi:hypothetical protein
VVNEEAEFYRKLAEETAIVVAEAVRNCIEPLERRLSRLEVLLSEVASQYQVDEL